ncbi:estrogen sulfotransferase-like protein [Leptotrombidium deliense]|uniref:Estrogen sulfotransferase-like protein n=1 Tax=Leptotrombidium deliense TaxID=299467 RepID=A0A443S3I9_9ACAR|nr:estrogen sulfotransferase-like protein [Leptotrombidium deliense]
MISLPERFPYLEWPLPGINWLKRQTGKRLIKTHLPLPFFTNALKSNAKIVTIIRDPKDVLVSFYYFARMNNLIGFTDDFSKFFELFVKDKVAYGPIWKHYSDFISLVNNSEQNEAILVVHYEKLKSNFEDEVDRICKFLGKRKLSEYEMSELKKHCCFESMKVNPSVNYEHWDQLGVRNLNESEFFRKGIVGDWKAHFSPQQRQTFNEWFKQNFDASIVEMYDERYETTITTANQKVN